VHTLDRRTFLTSAGLAVASAPWLVRTATAAGFTAQDYANAIVIDALGGPDTLDPTGEGGEAEVARSIADIRASGVTAVNLTVGSVGNSARFGEALSQIADYEGVFLRYPQVVMKVRSAADLRAAKSSGRLGIIYGFQDTAMLEGQISRLATFRNLGVLIVQPTYNRRNLMGDGCLEPANGGLSLSGRELIAEINRLNILLDLSHAGSKVIAEGITLSNAPMAIKHI
jgi:membrane dipeptidase